MTEKTLYWHNNDTSGYREVSSWKTYCQEGQHKFFMKDIGWELELILLSSGRSESDLALVMVSILHYRSLCFTLKNFEVQAIKYRCHPISSWYWKIPLAHLFRKVLYFTGAHTAIVIFIFPDLFTNIPRVPQTNLCLQPLIPTLLKSLTSFNTMTISFYFNQNKKEPLFVTGFCLRVACIVAHKMDRIVRR